MLDTLTVNNKRGTVVSETFLQTDQETNQLIFGGTSVNPIQTSFAGV